MKEPVLFSELVPDHLTEEEYLYLGDVISSYHSYSPLPHQCSSVVVQRINAPVAMVWSLVRRFDKPQSYKNFVRSCHMKGDGNVGSIREVSLISGLPATNSTERLEVLDDDKHVLSFSVLGGEHRLNNYSNEREAHVKEMCTSRLVGGIVKMSEALGTKKLCIGMKKLLYCKFQNLLV
ncbi:hypothetical protein GOP47_0026497 [Adiantum capillus-veneris]|nr:hypothetical protein GOP47_0026497 [Adiantum capillus-veneris]